MVTGLWAVWVGPPFSDKMAGPTWLVTVFALSLSAPLLWRRSHSVLVMVLVVSGFAGLAATAEGSSEGFPNFSVWVAAYSVAAYGKRHDALFGFTTAVAGYVVFALADPNIQGGRSGDLWSGAFFGVLLVASWLVGLVVHNHRSQRAREARAFAREQAAEAAVAAERSRLAHELHDIVSHNLSVVVVQAAGARAQGESRSLDALEKIEQSGRQALVEMRRLLGVLRSDTRDVDASLQPQPGIDELEPLADSVRAVGVPVELSVSGDYTTIAPAVQLTVYRVVQEALTNVLKHAPGARANVVIHCATDEVTVDITDYGAKHVQVADDIGGHGLQGMAERIKLYGGDLAAGPRPGGGFSVHARLPVRTAET